MTVNSTSWKKMQIADRDQLFDADDAIKRLFDRAAEPGSAFFYRNEQGDPQNKESYRLPFADVIDGKLVLVPHAIYAAAALLSGAHGGLPNVPDDEKQKIRDVISEVYIKLREMFNDPRIRPPWDRGKPPEERSDANMTIKGQSVDQVYLDEALRAFDDPAHWSYWDVAKDGLPDTWVRVIEFAADASPDKPYGDVEYADPGHQEDGVSRYPIDTEKHIRAAWGYINQKENADKYSPEDLKKVRDKIKAAAKDIGMEISEESEEMAVKEEDDCPEGQHKMPNGKCMDDDDPSMDRGGYVLLAAGVMRPPREWFERPKLSKPTALQITEDGRVFGHLAQWGVCHTGIGNSCVSAPRSITNYSYFRNGEVICADGSHLSVGKISLGGGHAAPGLGYIPALTHYDSTSSCVAIVDAGEDSHGIWVAGALVPGLDEATIAAFRRSPLSGDWRRVGGNLELIAALCVNTPGYPVVRMENDLQLSLVAAGVLNGPVIVDFDSEAREVAESIRKQRLEEVVKWQRIRRWGLVTGKFDTAQVAERN